MFVVERLFRQLTEQNTTILSSYERLCSDLKSLDSKNQAQYLLTKQEMFRKPLLTALENCKNRNWTLDDLKVILLAYDHYMFNAEYVPIRQVSWLSVIAALVEHYDSNGKGETQILLRLFKFLKNCSLIHCESQIPLLLLNSMVKDLESMDREKIIRALKIAKEYCETEDSKSILIPKLLPLLQSAYVNDACKAMVVKLLAKYECEPELVWAKLQKSSSSPSIQCAIKLFYPRMEIRTDHFESNSAVINFVLKNQNSEIN